MYIGQSTNIESRLKDHFRRLKNGKADNSRLQNAWNKYGKECFETCTIEECIKDFNVMNEREIYWIGFYDSLNKKVGYNIAAGGGNGYSLAGKTETERKAIYKRIGATRKIKYSGTNAPNYGVPMSEAQKIKISNTLSGAGGYYYGKKRKEHSILMTGSKNPRSKKVICINTGEIFDCAKYAGEKYNTTNSNILKCCRGVQKYAGRLDDGTKLVWEYVKEVKQIES